MKKGNESSAPRRTGRPSGGEDIRSLLLQAALDLLEATADPSAVTVAAIVEEAGCTPPSLYHYWPTRDLLLLEASATGWDAFRSTQIDAVEGIDDPLERIRRRGDAYLTFSLARPSLFRVLFLSPRVSAGPEPRSSGPGAALASLVEDVAEAMAKRLIRAGDATTTALAVWGAIHGIAALWVMAPEIPREHAWVVARLQQDALMKGLAPPSGGVGPAPWVAPGSAEDLAP